MRKENTLVIYQAENGAIALKGDSSTETIWATQKQMAEVFCVDVRTINEHIENIFKTKELHEDSVLRKFLITATDGKKYNTNHYNLDVIISVGYRVNSKTATSFRKWATQTLKQHITKGYTINPTQIEKNYDQFLHVVVEEVKALSQGNTLLQKDDILELVKSFAGCWFSLEAYDSDRLPEEGMTKKSVQLESQDLYFAIADFKKELLRKKEATPFFAQEKIEKSPEGIFGNIFQTALVFTKIRNSFSRKNYSRSSYSSDITCRRIKSKRQKSYYGPSLIVTTK